MWLAGCGTWDICLGAIALPFGLISLLQTGRTWWDARFAVVVHHSPLRPAHILLIRWHFTPSCSRSPVDRKSKSRSPSFPWS
ncbi:MAG: hypothetical protein R3F31_05330 [Verrucomicrobiales bacterium]